MERISVKEMKKLAEALEFFGCVPDQRILWSFELYMRRVLEWNEHVNLTTIRDRDDFIEKHFIDSLCCLSDDRWKSAQTVVDVGTGAGFPGIPLAIVSPEKEFLLIDSLNKRIRIINELIGELGLRNVRAVHGRAEEMARQKQYRQKFDVCVSRAVSRMSVLSEYCLPFLHKGGWLIAYKGPDAEKELKEAQNALNILGGQLDEVTETHMEEYGLFHKIVYIKKIKETPKQYPRKAGTPDRQPL